MTIVCYAQPFKQKSKKVLEAFAAGCGGRMSSTEVLLLEAGECAFYGVRPGWVRLWLQAKAEGRDWYYLDNAFFDFAREHRFRVAKNCVQQTEFNDPTDRVFSIPISPWRMDGEHIVVCPQSTEFMLVVEGWSTDWTEKVSSILRRHTTRPFTIRRKGARRSLREDLRGAWACVAHSSAAANEALLAGIPVFTTGKCAATALGCSDLSLIEAPLMPEGRERWAQAVAAHQWTLEEMANGDAWRSLNAD